MKPSINSSQKPSQPASYLIANRCKETIIPTPTLYIQLQGSDANPQLRRSNTGYQMVQTKGDRWINASLLPHMHS
jgi:hypothetical protein